MSERHPPPPEQAPQTQPERGNGVAVASLVLGITGMLAWLIPFIGLPINLTGLILGMFGWKSSSRDMATAGMVLSSIGLVLSIAAATLVVLVALGRMQARTPSIPNWVFEQEQTLITAEPPFEEKTFRYGDIIKAPIDPDTGYRRMGGKLWATPMECARSVLDGNPHKIPIQPHIVRLAPVPEDEDIFKPYPCPICAGEANPEVVDFGRH